MKKRERNLLYLLLLMLAAFGIVIVSDYYFDRKALLLAEKNRLENEWIRIQTLMEERETWEARADWLDQSQPAYEETEEIEDAIFARALNASQSGVETSDQVLLSTEFTPFYTQSGVSLKATGPLPDLFQWLYDLEKPEEFHVIRNLKVFPSQDEPGQLVAAFQLLRWYRPL